MSFRSMRTAAMALALVACGLGTDSETPEGSGAFVQVYNTARAAGTLTVRIDGIVARSNLAFGATTDSIGIAAGNHTISLEPSAAGRSGGSVLVTLRDGALTTLLAVESDSIFIPQPLDDSGSVVPAGKSRLRVAHLAALAPDIEISRLQPDYPDPVNVMFPFNYGAVSPYILSDAGDWRVIVTDSTPGDTLVNLGPITIPSGGRRTIVLIDADSGSLQTLILDP